MSTNSKTSVFRYISWHFSKGLLIHHIPHLLCMFIVFMADILHIEVAVEGFFAWESCLFKPFPSYPCTCTGKHPCIASA